MVEVFTPSYTQTNLSLTSIFTTFSLHCLLPFYPPLLLLCLIYTPSLNTIPPLALFLMLSSSFFSFLRFILQTFFFHLFTSITCPCCLPVYILLPFLTLFITWIPHSLSLFLSYPSNFFLFPLFPLLLPALALCPHTSCCLS